MLTPGASLRVELRISFGQRSRSPGHGCRSIAFDCVTSMDVTLEADCRNMITFPQVALCQKLVP